MPASLPENGSISLTDSNGAQHNLSMTSSANSLSGTNTVTYQGMTLTVTISTTDGETLAVTYSTPYGNASFTLDAESVGFKMPGRPIEVAAVVGMHNDFARDGYELAKLTNVCDQLSQASEFLLSWGAIIAGCGVALDFTGLGLGAGVVLNAAGGTMALFGALLGAYHAARCY